MSDNTSFSSIQKNHFDNNRVIKVGLVLLLCLSFILLIPASHADGLFDFQMKLAKKGNIEAQYKVGEMYETGFGVKVDKAEALSWINKAADQGHETAKFKLLYWDIEKNGITKKNKAEYEALKEKADKGNPQAQYYIGKMYARGVGVKKSSSKALGWLNKAAFVGVLEAEREATLVRENQQRWAIEKQRRDEKKRAEKKAKQERERLAKQEQQKKLQAQKQAEAKARAEEAAKKNAAAASAQTKASEQAAEKAKKDKLATQQHAEQQRETAQRQAAQREAEKQAIIKKREADEKKRKTQFESDPCSGKSARFLSTCK